MATKRAVGPGSLGFWILALISLTWSGAAFAQSYAERPLAAPTVGLALSGGGARGIAHLGVLQALEELRVPIHYIAGTSMGSIIGGLYATGRTTSEMQELISEVRWEDVLSGKTSRDVLSYRDKAQERSYFLELEVGLGSERSNAPSGVVAGQNLLLTLRRAIGPLNTTDFTQLAIPFRAVATDINAAEPYVIDKGDLAVAMRASMAIPLVFDPVSLDGRLLADGGLLNNLPVDVAQDMGADLVIAVNVSSPLRGIDADSSFLSVAVQSIDAALVQNTIRSLGEADLVVAPDLSGLNASNFELSQQLIQRGYDATMRKRRLLRTLALSEAEYARYRGELLKPMTTNPPMLEFVEFEGNNRTATSRLAARTEALVDQPASVEQIEAAAQEIMAMQSFHSVGYVFVRDGDNRPGVRFLVQEKPWGPRYLRFGFELASDFDFDTDFNFRARYRQLNMNRLGGEWLADLEIGSRLVFGTRFYQPLDRRGRYFLRPYAEFDNRTQGFYESTSQTGQYDVQRMNAGLDLGIAWPGNELQVGIWTGSADADSQVGSPNYPRFNDDQGGVRFRYSRDTLDQDLFARSGSFINLEARLFRTSLGSDDRYERADLLAFRRFPIGSSSALHAEVNATWIDGDNLPASAYVTGGGFSGLAGYPLDALLGTRAMTLRVGGFSAIQPLTLPVLGPPRVLVLGHLGQVWSDSESVDFDDLRAGVLAGVTLDLLGSILFLGAGWSEDGDDRYYLRLGNNF